MALKYCSISKDGSYKYRFGAFRFPRVIPRHIRNHIETTQLIGHSGNDKRSIDNDSEGPVDGGGPASTLAAIATDNLILLFRILIFYREASHCDGFYNVVGDDLGGWPGHIVEETQSVFVEGRRLFLQRFSRTDYILPASVEMLCSLVDEWINFQSTAQRPTAIVPASWGRLRDAWRSRYKSNPGSRLVASPPRVAPGTTPASLSYASSESGGEVLRMGAVPVPKQEVSPVVRAWVSALDGAHDCKHQERTAARATDCDGDSDSVAQDQAYVSGPSQTPESKQALVWPPEIPVHASRLCQIRDNARSTKRDRPPSPVRDCALDAVHSSQKNENTASQNARPVEIPNVTASTTSCAVTSGPLTTRSSPIMGNPSLPLAVPRTSNTSITSALANVNVATDSIDALFGIGRKGPDPSATAGNTMGANANQSMGTSDKSATSPVTNILGSQSTNIASTLAGDEAPGRTGASNLTPPTSSGPPVYKARRTPSESAWHREGRSNAELARQIKPEVPNCVGALTSAAIASALAPLHIPAGAVSPTLSVSSASSSMFVTKYPETIESERGENGSAVGSIGSNTNNTKKNDPNERNKGAVGAARDASVGSTAKSKGSGFSKVPDQFILPDYLRIKQDGPLGSPGHKANASESGINQGKKHARSSSTGVDDDPPGGIPERPRKRVSFGSVSYTNPEHQPLSPAQSAQTKRKSSLFTSTAQAAQSTPKQAPALPAQDPPPARRASEPSPSKTLGGSATLPSKASPTPIKVNDSSDKLANRPVAKREAPANEVVPDKVPRTAVVHSPTKFHRLFIGQSPTKSRAAVAKVLAAPVKYQVVPPKPEAAPAKPPCGPTHPPPSLPPKPPVAQIKTQPTPAMSQKPPRKDAPAKPEAIPTKKQTLPVKTQSSPTKKVLQSKNAVPAKAGEAMPAPAVSKPQVQKNNDTRPVLSDLSLRETATPQPQIPATSEFSEAERRAEQAQAVIEFIKAQTTAQLGCLQPLLKSGGAENNMLQCNLEMIRAQLDALGYASRAALDRIQARKHQRRKENEPVAGA